MPQQDPHIQFQAWAREYGPIYSLTGTTTMIVLSSDTVVKDLMDRRSAICSDRPDNYLAQNLASHGLRYVLMTRIPFDVIVQDSLTDRYQR